MTTGGSRPTWSGRMVFLLATIGAAVGLGNIWKFPYTAGMEGGGAFVLVYVVAAFAVAAPIVIAELLIGRRGRGSPVRSFERLAREAGVSGAWRLVGWLSIAAVFIILSFYRVIAGWCLAYLPRAAIGTFRGASSYAVAAEFDALLAAPGPVAMWHGAFLALTAIIVSRGLQRGIERAVAVFMPALFAMLVALVAYGCVSGDAPAAARLLFHPDFAKLTPAVALSAIGQAFFSVSVAMGLTITYGSYMRDRDRIVGSAMIIVAADTAVAMLAGLAIFPVLFANGLDPAGGPGLIFIALPLAFGAMPFGSVFGTLFFFLLVFAALTSSIAILETVIGPIVERGARRGRAAWMAAGAAWLAGLATVFSFNLWQDVRPLGMLRGSLGELDVFGLLDHLTSNIMLPAGGILIALFAGWIIPRRAALDELGAPDHTGFGLWRLLLRYVIPLALIGVTTSMLR